MSRIVLDTSAYSNLGRGNPAIDAVVRGANRVWFSPVVFGELVSGFISGEREKANRAQLRAFLSNPIVTMGAITESTADFFGEIQSYLKRLGRPIPSNDIWIAASAMEHGLVVVTFDAHFGDIPQVRSDLHTRG